MNPSRTAYGRWVVQSGRMMAVIPYAHVSENSVIHRLFLGRALAAARNAGLGWRHGRRIADKRKMRCELRCWHVPLM